jgi:hypothetical protein
VLGLLGRGGSGKGTGDSSGTWGNWGITASYPHAWTAQNVANITGMNVGQERFGTLGTENDSYFGTYLFTVVNPMALAQLFPGYWAGVAAVVGTGIFDLVGVPITSALAAYGQAMMGGAADITYGSAFSVSRGTSWTISGTTKLTPETFGLGVMVTIYSLTDFALFVMQEAFTPSTWPSGDATLAQDAKNRYVDLVGTLPHTLYEVWLAFEVWTKVSAGLIPGDDYCTIPGIASPTLVDVKAKYKEIMVMAAADAVSSFMSAALTTAQGIPGGASPPSAPTPPSGSGGGSGLPQTTPQIHVDDKAVDHVVIAPTVTIAGLGALLELPTVTVQACNEVGSATLTLQVDEAIPTVTLDCGADGVLTLQSGVEMEPNFLMMDPEGILISSLELVTIQSAENHVLVDAEEGVTLQALENLLTVSDEGILLSVGASSILISDDSITLEAGGATLEMSSAGIVLNGVSLALSADSDLSLSAPMTMME